MQKQAASTGRASRFGFRRLIRETKVAYIAVFPTLEPCGDSP